MAADTILSLLQTVGVGRVLIAGRFTTVNGAVPTVIEGTGFTVARSGEGDWLVTITTEPAPSQIISLMVDMARETLIVTDTSELYQTFVDQDSITNAAFHILNYKLADIDVDDTGGSLEDDPGSEISFIAVVQMAGGSTS